MIEPNEMVKIFQNNYEVITENIDELIVIINHNSEIEFINKIPLMKSLGKNVDDLIGKSWLNYIHDEDLEKAINVLEICSEEKSITQEIRLQHRNGDVKTFNSSYRKVNGSYGTDKILIVLKEVAPALDQKKGSYQTKESNDRFSLIIENANDIIALYNEKLDLEYVNESVLKEVLGYSFEDIKGKSSLNIINPEDMKTALDNFKNAFQFGEAIGQTRIKCKKGGYKWFESKGKVFMENGVKKLILISRDITEKKEAEFRFTESGERLKYLVSSSPSVIYTAKVTKDFGITFISENVTEKTGYDPDDFLKNPRFWETKIHPEDKQIVLSRLSQLPTLENLGIEYRLKYKDGLYHWVRHDIKLVKDDRGIPTETIGSLIDITLNKKNEEKIQYQAKLVDHISDAIISTDLNFNIISWNKAAESIYGWKSDEVLMRNVKDIIPRVHPYNNKEWLSDILLKKGIWTGEATHLRKDGTKLNILSSISVIKDITGTPIGAVSINHDITNIKKAEKKIRDSEGRYRDLFENSPVALMEQDFSKLKLHVEKLQASGIKDFEKYFENNPEELLKCMYMVKVVDVNRKTLDVYKANGKEDFLARMNQPTESLKYMTQDVLLDNKREILSLIRGETMYESELTSKTSKGEPAHLYARTSVIPGFEDTWQKIILSIVDITNLKRTQEKLRESELKFRTIAEQSVLGVTIQQDGFIKFANAAVAEIIEYPLHIISDWTVEDTYSIIHKDDVELITAKFKERQEGNFRAVTQYECRIITKSGKLKWVDIYTKPIIYEGRNAVLSTFMDITGKKQLEEELKEVSRLKTELLSRTSHELKTPLVSIKGYADLLLNQHYEDLDFYTVSILHEIKQGCSRLESLINDLLESSKLESGEIKLNKLEDDLAFLIRFCVRDLKGLVETRKHNLIMDIKEKMITYFEKERIYEVIINLLSNAIKYTPPNGKIIIRSKIQKGTYVISVQDTGIGLTNEEKEKIFKKFGKIERYGQGLDVVSEGSGLGLYISKKIIELHGGNIWVKSKGRKKGSTFYFSLPINPN